MKYATFNTSAIPVKAKWIKREVFGMTIHQDTNGEPKKITWLLMGYYNGNVDKARDVGSNDQ